MKATRRLPKYASAIAKSAILLIGGGFYVSALAANNLPAGDNKISLTPDDLGIPVKTLADRSDHVLVPVAGLADETTKQSEMDPQSIAPILSLTPRVLNILDQVFATDALSPATSELNDAQPASPVADSDDSQSEKKESVQSIPLLRPQIQSQMYRKDI